MAVSVVGAVAGICAARNWYKDLKRVETFTKNISGLHRLLENKWYIDEIYDAALVRPIQKFSEFLWKGLDVALIDRIVLNFGRISAWTGEAVRVFQTGSLQVYALMLLIGLVAAAGYLIYGLV